MENAQKLLPGVQYCENAYELASGADAVILVTEWNEFKQLDMGRIARSMKRPVLIDGRNIYEPDKMRALGFDYRGIGCGYNADGRPL